jgi:flagellar biosynthesis protein FliR
MISFTSAQLEAWLALFFWPFTRIMAWIMVDPIFGNLAVPRRVKVFTALLLTVVLAPLLPPLPPVNPASAEGLLVLVQQILIGASLGFVMRAVFAGIEMAGHLTGLQMGLGFATFFDPQNAAQTPVVAQFLTLFTVLVLLSVNGHLLLIHALSESFRTLPVGMGGIGPEDIHTLVLWGGEIFRLGVLLSLPVIAALLITNLSIGVMTRAAPQLNIFAVGFPLTLAAGFLVIYLALSRFVPVLMRTLEQAMHTASTILGGGG